MAHSSVRRALWARLALTIAGAITLVTCTDQPTSSPENKPAATPSLAVGGGSPQSVVLVGAGNVARCDKTFDEQTAALIATMPGTVFTIGDNVYGGTDADFANCYGPTWGTELSRTRPAAGEGDYVVPGGSPYFGYFGAAAGDSDKGYYSYETGTWHVVVLNSSTSMTVGSPQQQWLAGDLAATTKPCVLAYWHFPRFSSFGTAVRTEIKPLWDALYGAQADVVLNSHYRYYERHGLQTPAGAADPELGIRQFIVGTGGQGTDGVSGITPRANSEAIKTNVYGVLRMTLNAQTYSWEFISTLGQTLDSGEGACHGRPGAPLPNNPPTARPGGPYQAERTVTFNASASTDVDNDVPLHYTWNFGDGTTGAGVNPTKTYAANGTYVATLIVTDALGLESEPVSTTVTIANIAPAVSAGPDATVQVKTDYTMNATFMDVADRATSRGRGRSPGATEQRRTAPRRPTERRSPGLTNTTLSTSIRRASPSPIAPVPRASMKRSSQRAIRTRRPFWSGRVISPSAARTAPSEPRQCWTESRGPSSPSATTRINPAR